MGYNLNSPTAIHSAPDLENLDVWFESELQFLNSPEEELLLRIIVKNIDYWVKFPNESSLFMLGSDRKKKYHSFSDEIKAYAKSKNVRLDGRGNGPAKASYLLNGGDRPQRKGSNHGWSIHHIYSGKFPHPSKGSTLHATKSGNHCTHSAGLVAIHPIADAMADEYACFSWYLRALAFKKFNYDPDNIFSNKIKERGFMIKSEWKSTRLKFIREQIEFLNDNDSFKIVCDHGVFIMRNISFTMSSKTLLIPTPIRQKEFTIIPESQTKPFSSWRKRLLRTHRQIQQRLGFLYLCFEI